MDGHKIPRTKAASAALPLLVLWACLGPADPARAQPAGESAGEGAGDEEVRKAVEETVRTLEEPRSFFLRRTRAGGDAPALHVTEHPRVPPSSLPAPRVLEEESLALVRLAPGARYLDLTDEDIVEALERSGVTEEDVFRADADVSVKYSDDWPGPWTLRTGEGVAIKDFTGEGFSPRRLADIHRGLQNRESRWVFRAAVRDKMVRRMKRDVSLLRMDGVPDLLDDESWRLVLRHHMESVVPGLADRAPLSPASRPSVAGVVMNAVDHIPERRDLAALFDHFLGTRGRPLLAFGRGLREAQNFDDFFRRLEPVDPTSLPDAVRPLFDDLIDGHASAILDLGPSPEQVKLLASYGGAPFKLPLMDALRRSSGFPKELAAAFLERSRGGNGFEGTLRAVLATAREVRGRGGDAAFLDFVESLYAHGSLDEREQSSVVPFLSQVSDDFNRMWSVLASGTGDADEFFGLYDAMGMDTRPAMTSALLSDKSLELARLDPSAGQIRRIMNVGTKGTIYELLLSTVTGEDGPRKFSELANAVAENPLDPDKGRLLSRALRKLKRAGRLSFDDPETWAAITPDILRLTEALSRTAPLPPPRAEAPPPGPRPDATVPWPSHPDIAARYKNGSGWWVVSKGGEEAVFGDFTWEGADLRLLADIHGAMRDEGLKAVLRSAARDEAVRRMEEDASLLSADGVPDLLDDEPWRRVLRHHLDSAVPGLAEKTPPSRGRRPTLAGTLRGALDLLAGSSPDLARVLDHFLGPHGQPLSALKLGLEGARDIGDVLGRLAPFDPKDTPDHVRPLFDHLIDGHASAILDLGPSPEQLEQLTSHGDAPLKLPLLDALRRSDAVSKELVEMTLEWSRARNDFDGMLRAVLETLREARGRAGDAAFLDFVESLCAHMDVRWDEMDSILPFLGRASDDFKRMWGILSSGGGDADEFFGLYDAMGMDMRPATASLLLSGNVGRFMGLGPSADQVRRVMHLGDERFLHDLLSAALESDGGSEKVAKVIDSVAKDPPDPVTSGFLSKALRRLDGGGPGTPRPKKNCRGEVLDVLRLGPG